MSNISDPKPNKRVDRVENEHKKINEPYSSTTKRKFEGWPILWILIALLMVFLILWYTGTTKDILKWIDGR
ncbi:MULTISPECIES: hypothetical protein [Pedobacter]|uniref:hypothetical protein n=1 Tax=Pedobacter TaxID=84567 RepID=UPI001E6170DF|nr:MULTISPECIES: hypothetical protein [Pedobacter]